MYIEKKNLKNAIFCPGGSFQIAFEEREGVPIENLKNAFFAFPKT